MKFVLAIPRYTTASAGIRVLWYLKDLMDKAGYNSKIVLYEGIGEPDMQGVTVEQEDIVVYPDCCPKNALNAKRVVRYMCAPASWPYPGFFGGGRIPVTELVIPYHRYVCADVQAHYDGKLTDIITLPSIEPGLFYPEKKSIRDVIYTGKRTVTQMPDVNGAIVITRVNFKRDEVADMLRKTENFYSMDHYTAMTHEALLCKCNVFEVVSNGNTRRFVTDNIDYVMNPEKDVKLAIEFCERSLKFFS